MNTSVHYCLLPRTAILTHSQDIIVGEFTTFADIVDTRLQYIANIAFANYTHISIYANGHALEHNTRFWLSNRM